MLAFLTLAFLSAACLTLGLLTLWPGPAAIVRWRLGDPAAVDVGRTPWSNRLVRLLAVVAGSAVVIGVGGPAHRLIVGGTVVGVVGAAWHFRRIRRARTQREMLRADMAEAIDALTSELESGILATRALASVASDWPILSPAASASRLGGDVAAAIRMAADRPGAEALDRLAAAWEISERTGAAQADVLDRMGRGLRDERELQREITAGLGPSRATARLLAGLPVLGLALGSGIRGESLHILFGTLTGSLCLAAGVFLACAGLAWVEHIASAAERW